MRAVPLGWARIPSVVEGRANRLWLWICMSACCSPSLWDLTKMHDSATRTEQKSHNRLQTLEFHISWAWRCSSFVWHMLMIFRARLNLPLQYPGWWTGTRPSGACKTSRVLSGSASHKYRSDQTFCLAGVGPQMVVRKTAPDLRLLAGGRGRPLVTMENPGFWYLRKTDAVNIRGLKEISLTALVLLNVTYLMPYTIL